MLHRHGLYRILWVGLSLLTLFQVSSAESLIPPGSETKTLPNGMKVVIVPTDAKDVVALQIVMAVGSRNEVEEGKSGFAHFFEHLMFRGTERYPSDKADAMLKEAGVSSNAWTWDDQTVYHKVFLKEDLAKILDYEADRFQNLKYAEPEFKTEALAVLGEYNKNSANPTEKMFEVMQETAFDAHTYKHTTMGFLRDIEQYPQGFEYSREFYNRFYRPEYATLLLVGDVKPSETIALVERTFGDWKRGSYVAELPLEPRQKSARKAHIDWESPTLPWIMIGYKAPPFSDLDETAAVQLWEALAFSKTGELYQDLVLDQQIVDEFMPFFWLKKDPFLVGVAVRVTDETKIEEVKKRLYEAFESSTKKPVDAKRLEEVKSRVKYSFLQSLDAPDSIATNLAFMLSLDSALSSVDRYYQSLENVDANQLTKVAAKVFQPSGRTTVTLTMKDGKKQ